MKAAEADEPDPSAPRRNPAARRAAVIGTVLVLLAAAGYGTATALQPDDRTATALFDHTTGLYAGSDVRVLGVRVGRVTAVKPEGTRVRATLALDPDVHIPQGADAVIVTPSVVADRYIQLTPAYTGGPRMADGALIPASRTATPLEIDQLYSSLSKLADSLGPHGANKNGALSQLISTGAANLDGNGKAIGDALAQLGKATRTLANHKGNLFATIRYLQSFTAMLQRNNTGVATAESQLSDVATFLAADRTDLASALKQLAIALDQVQSFVKDNRAKLKHSIDLITPIAQTLVDQRASLAETLDTVPLAADNVLRAYNPSTRTLDSRGDLNEISMGKILPLPGTDPTTTAGGSTP
ncbi:ABC transporter substrate-binding protein [Mangrovactinospora gilvigrisea]|uniref:ABC transporter substrate-binding protein n=1 Tax=Mangrovactinospora gilvigrisea TaxID=1428644 RepID=A0A1J7BBS5_9ACTN|nr:ABC transporter substrate-binding protein [Mangrovactinospora gilvigrisea]